MTEIRRAVPEDLDALRGIQAETLAEPWPELLETAVEGSLPLFVATESQPIGYAVLVPGPEAAVYMPELAVRPGRQDSGIGSRLVNRVVAFLEAQDYETLSVTVRAIDDRARRFYEMNGFEQRERLEDYFDSGDGFVFARPIG